MSEEMDEAQLAGTLMELSLFEDLAAGQVSQVVTACARRELPAGTVLCEAQTVDESLFINLEGVLRLESADGVRLDELGPGSVSGEMGVLTGHPRSSRIVVEEAATVLELEGADLVELVESDHDMGHQILLNLVKVLYARVHDINADVVALRSHLDRVRDRLAELAPDDPLLADLPGGEGG